MLQRKLQEEKEKLRRREYEKFIHKLEKDATRIKEKIRQTSRNKNADSKVGFFYNVK